MNRRQFVLGIAASFAVPSAVMAAVPHRPDSVLTETELAPGLTLLYYHVVFNESGGWTLFGEYRNDTDQTYDAPFVNIRFGDEAGNTYWQDYATPLGHVISPGEVRIFSKEIYKSDFDLIEGWTVVEVSACAWGQTYEVDSIGGVSFTVDSSRVDQDGSSVEGVVQLTNSGSMASNRPWLEFVCRDSKKRVVGSDTIYVDAPIQPGKFVRVKISEHLVTGGVTYEFVPREDDIRVVSC